MLCKWLRRRTESRTADTMKPQRSPSPPAVFVYSVPLKYSGLSFMDIAWSKGKSHFTSEILGMRGECAGATCRGQRWACLLVALLVDSPLGLARAGCSTLRCGARVPLLSQLFLKCILARADSHARAWEQNKPFHTVLGFVLMIGFCGFHSPQVN